MGWPYDDRNLLSYLASDQMGVCDGHNMKGWVTTALLVAWTTQSRICAGY
jgi:hypothetical protein